MPRPWRSWALGLRQSGPTPGIGTILRKTLRFWQGNLLIGPRLISTRRRHC